MNYRKKLIFDTNTLDIKSKIKLFNYINSNITSNYMENTNGVFFSLNDISDKEIKLLLSYIDELKKFEQMNADNLDLILFDNEEVMLDSNVEHGNNEDSDCVEKEDDSIINTKKVSFVYDKNVVKELENNINKVNKKSILVKYSIAKKKYNKQHNQLDPKKIDNTDLKELEEEVYML